MRETAQEPKSMLKAWEQKDQEVRMAACVCVGGGVKRERNYFLSISGVMLHERI